MGLQRKQEWQNTWSTMVLILSESHQDLSATETFFLTFFFGGGALLIKNTVMYYWWSQSTGVTGTLANGGGNILTIQPEIDRDEDNGHAAVQVLASVAATSIPQVNCQKHCPVHTYFMMAGLSSLIY